VVTFIVPKNSGLKICKEIVKKLNLKGKIIEIRGEDIPLFVDRLTEKNKAVLGITGEDLFNEFILKNKSSNLKINKKILWQDKECIFGKPTLCLLGPKNKKLGELKKNLRICINSKYKELAKRYCLKFLKNRDYLLEKIYVSGATEDFFSKGIADLVIDIVYSGKSAKEANLEVYDRIFSSDIVVIGGKNEKV